MNRYEEVVQAVLENNGNKAAAAKQLGISRSQVRRILGLGTMKDQYSENAKGNGMDVTNPPEELQPVEDLVEERKRKFTYKQAHERGRALIPVKVRMPGPIGILHFGDPHVDDDGTDIGLLEYHTNLCRETEGLFAANVGDTTNNWVGRLARLYGEQSTSAAEAWQLAEWFLNRTPWLYVIGGNHDAWSGQCDPLKWILRTQAAVYQSSEVRLNLVFSNKREVRVNAHHDFAGHSQWNPAHGAMKAAQMGFRDHILVNGHKHVSGYGLVKCPATGVISHCIQVASYKIYDRYARDKGFRDQFISPSVLTVIDPDADSMGLVTVFHSIDEGVDYLKFKRRKL